MCGGGGSSTPQPAVNVPQPPSYGQQLSDYIKNYPKLFQLEKEYGPQEAALTLDILKQYGPEYNQFLKQQQEQLSPETAQIQEGLAGLVNQNAGYGDNVNGVPRALQSQYLDTLRAELGPNAGSGIGADYVSRGLAQLGEQYKQNYQNLGLSLLQRQPVQQAMSSVPYQNPSAGLGGALSYGANTYGSYTNALTQVPYYTQSSSSSPWGSIIGGGLGAIGGSFVGQPMLGAGIGAGIGGMF
jgi:hypothetical protein